MEIDYNSLPDIAGADGYSRVPLVLFDYFPDWPDYKPRWIKDAVPRPPRRIFRGIESKWLPCFEPYSCLEPYYCRMYYPHTFPYGCKFLASLAALQPNNL